MGFSTYKYTPVLVLQFGLLAVYHFYIFYTPKLTAVVKGLESVHMMVIFGFAYLLTYLKKYCYSALGFSLLLAALAFQWFIICQLFIDIPHSKPFYYIDKINILEADMMVATVLISLGAMLGLAHGPELLLICFMEVIFAVVNARIVIKYFKAVDVGRSMCIHLFGAYFGIAVTFTLRSKVVLTDLYESSYRSDSLATLGSLILWVYWPTFNSVLTVSKAEYQRAVVNSYLALAASTVTTFAVAPIVNRGVLSMTYVHKSTLSGGVAIGSVCNMLVSPGEAIAIGMAAGILSVIGNRFISTALRKINIQDTCGVHNTHGLPGVLSGLLSVLYADVASVETYKAELSKVFPAMADEDGITADVQAMHQSYALLASLAIAIVGGLLVGVTMLTVPLLLTLLLIITTVRAQIEINIVLGDTTSDFKVDRLGSLSHIASTNKLMDFQLSASLVKGMVENSTGQELDGVFFHSMTSGDFVDLYVRNRWTPVTWTLQPKGYSAVENTESITQDDKSSNPFPDPMQSVINIDSSSYVPVLNSKWQNVSVDPDGEHLTIQYSASLHALNTVFNPNCMWSKQSYGVGGSGSLLPKTTENIKRTIYVKGLSTAKWQFSVKETTIEIEVSYECNLIGDVHCRFKEPFKGRRDWAYNVNTLLLRANLSRVVNEKETITLVFFTDPKIVFLEGIVEDPADDPDIDNAEIKIVHVPGASLGRRLKLNIYVRYLVFYVDYFVIATFLF